ncbi:MAG: FAD-binding protein, partial [Treponema sp.]|nr:FAD-binding protein [Treponema sp.]
MKKNKPAVFLSLVVWAAGCAGSGQVQYADSIDWDAEYDVVVVGFGGAGASASIAAAEAGAKVLLTEKAPLGHEGGNTRYCFQVIRNYHDYNKGIQYVTAEAEGFDHMTSDIIDFIVRGSMENADWLKSLGLPAPEPGSKALGEYPEYPGADQTFAESIVDPSITNGKTYWETMRRGVVERKDKITVWFESPALHLIQDPYTKTVIGVQINHHGTLRKVRALNGVVLACGGFENNEEMVEFYTQRERMYPLGTTYNTGDGVNMALEAGAALWHMNAISGPWITIKTPGMDRAHFNTGMPQNIAKNYAAIYVGKDGARFMNESGWHRHGHIYYSGNFYSQLTPDPIYIIFDESARRAGLDTPPAFGTDLSAEIANGTVIRANTIRELAEKIGVWVDSADPLVSVTHPEWDETYRTVGLENQINAYNRYCADKFDPQFNRRPETLVPISQPPFYALELQPAMVNTQGGARRNIACE